MKTLNNYINGEWVKSKNSDTHEVLNPANQEVLTKVPFGKDSKTDVDKTVRHAHKAYLTCKDVPTMKTHVTSHVINKINIFSNF